MVKIITNHEFRKFEKLRMRFEIEMDRLRESSQKELKEKKESLDKRYTEFEKELKTAKAQEISSIKADCKEEINQIKLAEDEKRTLLREEYEKIISDILKRFEKYTNRKVKTKKSKK